MKASFRGLHICIIMAFVILRHIKKDLYATTIAKIKNELTRQKILDYKTRIEKLDWFWQKIVGNSSKEKY